MTLPLQLHLDKRYGRHHDTFLLLRPRCVHSRQRRFGQKPQLGGKCKVCCHLRVAGKANNVEGAYSKRGYLSRNDGVRRMGGGIRRRGTIAVVTAVVLWSWLDGRETSEMCVNVRYNHLDIGMLQGQKQLDHGRPPALDQDGRRPRGKTNSNEGYAALGRRPGPMRKPANPPPLHSTLLLPATHDDPHTMSRRAFARRYILGPKPRRLRYEEQMHNAGNYREDL